MSDRSDDKALKLHTAPDGIVWFADGERVPIPSGVPVSRFADQIPHRRNLLIRVLGMPQNAALIGILQTVCRQQEGTLEIATPRLCQSTEEQKLPDIALHRMRTCELSPAMGGWHSATAADLATYELIAQLYHDMDYTPAVASLLTQHPAWHDLQFIPGISPSWAAWLLSFVVDPRWFVDFVRPHRCCKLTQYMGLCPDVQRRVSNNPNSGGAMALRCRAVLRTWKTEPPQGDAKNAPGNFLWRIFRTDGGVRGDLRASQQFIVYLWHTWLQAIYATRQPGGDGLFIPERFFKTREEIAAYAVHQSRRRTSF